ncbi:CDP-glucose 4,6-dehydratase [Curvibacter sp. HBC28]|uniref:CDP-glucose 4,6-dehydratase n=1 Tax=Curvibacter microcysteis TaxID=3026419 RepID=A0ABT5ML32_9BURK|nr:CDP-glucose 4,6-dehydratase [Curvibacter sp. HBC28]MDD0816584.1 CDP-glucose 4,6-dehydratase [Curvibacter sp. HBC28]
MEDLVNPSFWAGKRVFITGHTGFKGSWLCLWLSTLGARVSGYALAPSTTPNLFEAAAVAQGLAQHTLGDIRDPAALRAALAQAQPDLVLHLAAQPLVPRSYEDPLETWSTNVMGTAQVLEAVRQQAGVRAVLVVSSDKCYENREWAWGYRESDPMGGHDPYSASKGATELVVASYRRSFLAAQGIALGSARAGNVIGGGDWTPTRLVPDVLAAFAAGRPVTLRQPGAIRPWQHVLEPLRGYLALAQKLYEEGPPWAEGWNFGPQPSDARTVAWVVGQLAQAWGPDAAWAVESGAQAHEAHTLKLDCSQAHSRLGWQPRWSAATALQHTLSWYRAWQAGADMRQHSLAQINEFESAA